MVSVDLTKRNTIVAPYVATTTGEWDGDDGKYTSFLLAVGTPPQSFRVFPATIDPIITVPLPPGCQGQLQAWSDCGNSRGVDQYNGQSSQGFATPGTSGGSTTYNQIGIYDLFQYQNEYTSESAVIFRDTASIPTSSGGATIQMNNTVIAGGTSFWFWLGTIGLGSTSSDYNNGQLITPSLLTMMKNQSLIPSLSYAYTAGQHYNNVPGSLILGGYDPSRLSPNTVITPVDSSNGVNKLNLQVSAIYTQHGTDGNFYGTVSSDVFTASIDSSLSHMWFPGDVCDKIAAAFGLTYDASTALYTVNDTQHATLQANNASLTLSIGGNKSNAQNNIVMYYNSLDMQAGLPIYSNDTNYFPMKRAANSTQYVLGRAFLQEAYLVVDWERGNFTVGQVKPPSSSSGAVAITTPSVSSSQTATPVPTDTPASSGGIGGGAIAGIIIGVLAIAAIAFGIFYWRRRKAGKRMSFRKSTYSQPPPAYDTGAEFYGGGDKPEENMTEVKAPGAHLSELYDNTNPRHELTSDNVRKLEELAQDRELMSTPVAELHAEGTRSELDVTSTRTRDSVGSTGRSSTIRSSVVSPTRSSVLSPDRARLDHVFEME